ncbi:Pyruvate/Phosphoenolpyruvate kinase-like domain-containing protein [Rhodofomes roseus]|uniref:Pyruvate/Phosphoenolpyruvate kinase-like domain-containing protein n=1 Tax=Rhodofomes roseus TaxID=34475 RepID=A0ABQ8KD43_9APHY|nr:Pyruvate/Phosphoenolpyruvate kinase-like domain-containing protein [Rhodofomes roseus]KAH9835187.1 Pyruvate/Phosphoenolpyruvate kinase-like domain-containing protein [Rhodofomes roseus]
MSTHRLLEAFRTSKPAFGAWLTLPGAFNARVAATASPHLSWLLIDCEHGMTSLQPGAAESIVAISGLGKDAPSTIVRIPATGACADGSAGWQIKYVLDAGARGVLVPMVSTAAQATSVVAAARFPPKGIRGFGSPFTQTAWGISVADYLATANDGVIVMTQVETVDAVKNLDEILSVDGLDGVFIGPYDLSLAHGYPPPSPDPHPDMEVIIQEILRKAHAKGKKCAIYCTSGSQSAKRAEEGFDMINVTSDSGAMAQALAQSLAVAAGEQVGSQGLRY